MALTDEQRGPRAAWLRRHRIARFGSGDGGLVTLAAAVKTLGFDRSWQTYKGWESSDVRSPIPPEAEPYLSRLFDEPVPKAAVPIDTSLAGAISDLAKELRWMREGREAIEARLLGLEGVVSLLAERAGVAPQELAALRDAAGSDR